MILKFPRLSIEQKQRLPLEVGLQRIARISLVMSAEKKNCYRQTHKAEFWNYRRNDPRQVVRGPILILNSALV